MTLLNSMPLQGDPSERRIDPEEQTYFFTDRVLYRPGQTIRYKGIAVRIDKARNDYDVLKDCRVTVDFLDVNDEKIASQEHRTNDYGSFSGSFTAAGPVDGGDVGAGFVRTEWRRLV